MTSNDKPTTELKKRELPLANWGMPAIIDPDDWAAASEIKWIFHVSGKSVRRSQHPQISLANFVMGSESVIYDHKDRNPLNNSKANLRAATRQQNNFNCSKQSRKTSSRFKGVYWHKKEGKWRAQIQHNKKKFYLGAFDSEFEAAARYNKEAVIRFGEFASLNLI